MVFQSESEPGSPDVNDSADSSIISIEKRHDRSIEYWHTMLRASCARPSTLPIGVTGSTTGKCPKLEGEWYPQGIRRVQSSEGRPS